MTKLPVNGTLSFLSTRERFTIALGIAVIIFSSVGVFVGASNVIFICIMTLFLVCVMVVQQIKELRSDASILHESEERFRLLVSEVQDYAIFAVSPEGLVASWNQGAERMTGYSAAEIIGRPFSELRCGEASSEETTRIFSSVQENGKYQAEVWCKGKGERRFLTNTMIAPLLTQKGERRGYSVIIGDITAKKQAEQELLDSYRFIERITLTIPNLIFIFEPNGLKKLYINNNEVEAILGYSPSEIAARGVNFIDDVLHPDDKHRYVEFRHYSTSIKDGQIVEFDCRMKHAKGNWCWLHCRIVVFARTPQGVPNQFLGIGQDVTALKQIQEDTKRLEQAAVNRQRLAMLGELSAGVAHEIRNPLQGILSCVEEIRNHFDGDERLLPTIELLEDGLNRMDQISGRLLRLARTQDGEKAPTDVAQCIEGTCAFLRTRAQKNGIAIHTKVEPDLPPVPMVAERISEALLNLISNAIDACESGGIVTISAFRSEESGQLEFRVSDTGKGIPADVRGRIFDAFFTTKPIGKGTGLGMTIVRKNVEAHDGKVELVDTSVSGTTFRVLLPLA